MDREQEEIVLRLTAHYVEAIQAGHQPKISDYLARYPQYADAIANFIVYYQTIELPMSQSIDSQDIANSADKVDGMDEFADDLHIAIESAWQRVMVPETTLQSLLLTAKEQQLSPTQLAHRLTISEDILILLEQQTVLPESIPKEMYRQLAKILHRPERAVQAYLGLGRRQRVAEHSATYDAGNKRDTSRSSQKVNFREVIEMSEKLSAEQKKFWREVLTKEEL